jgi:hypothetical protein
LRVAYCVLRVISGRRNTQHAKGPGNGAMNVELRNHSNLDL